MAGEDFFLQVMDFPPLPNASTQKIVDPKNPTHFPKNSDVTSPMAGAAVFVTGEASKPNPTQNTKPSPTTNPHSKVLNLQFGTYSSPKSTLESNPAKLNSNESSLATAFSNPQDIQQIDGLPVVSIDANIKIHLLAKVKHTLVAKFSHRRPIYQDFHQFLKNCKLVGGFNISAFDYKHVFMEFEVFEDFVKIWMLKSCSIRGFPVRFFQWSDSFSPLIESSISPVWVHLPGLSLYMLDEAVLISIASALGRPLYLDPKNLNHKKVSYASFCIAIDVTSRLPEAILIEFKDQGGKSEKIMQKVLYDNLPNYCHGCSHMGHKVEACKGVKKVDIARGARTAEVHLVKTAESAVNAERASSAVGKAAQNRCTVSADVEASNLLYTVRQEAANSLNKKPVEPTVVQATGPIKNDAVRPKNSAGTEVSKLGNRPGNARSSDDGTSTTFGGDGKSKTGQNGASPLNTEHKGAGQTIDTVTKKSSLSPSWSDSADKNEPMDFSIPPFPLTSEGGLVEDVEEDNEEEETDEEWEESTEDGETDEEFDMAHQLEKFEKVSQILSSIKNTRIICKKHILADKEKWSYSEEEEAERVPEDFNLDPLMERNGEETRLSKLTESRAKLICQRSVSPVGRPSTRLKNLKTKMGSIDLQEKSAILMCADKYERTQRIKDVRQSRNTAEEWITPKRRGRPPKRQNCPKSRIRQTSPPNAKEPRKRGRPKKNV